MAYCSTALTLAGLGKRSSLSGTGFVGAGGGSFPVKFNTLEALAWGGDSRRLGLVSIP